VSSLGCCDESQSVFPSFFVTIRRNALTRSLRTPVDPKQPFELELDDGFLHNIVGMVRPR